MPDIKHTRTDLNLPCFVMYCSMEDTDIDYYILKIIERALYHNYVSNEKKRILTHAAETRCLMSSGQFICFLWIRIRVKVFNFNFNNFYFEMLSFFFFSYGYTGCSQCQRTAETQLCVGKVSLDQMPLCTHISVYQRGTCCWLCCLFFFSSCRWEIMGPT